MLSAMIVMLFIGGSMSTSTCRNVLDISCGGFACVAREGDGSIEAWGRDDYGGGPPTDVLALDNVVDVSCGGFVCAALTDTGDVHAWGKEEYGGNTTLTGVAEVSLGKYTCAAPQDRRHRRSVGKGSFRWRLDQCRLDRSRCYLVRWTGMRRPQEGRHRRSVGTSRVRWQRALCRLDRSR